MRDRTVQAPAPKLAVGTAPIVAPTETLVLVPLTLDVALMGGLSLRSLLDNEMFRHVVPPHLIADLREMLEKIAYACVTAAQAKAREVGQAKDVAR